MIFQHLPTAQHALASQSLALVQPSLVHSDLFIVAGQYHLRESYQQTDMVLRGTWPFVIVLWHLCGDRDLVGYLLQVLQRIEHF